MQRLIYCPLNQGTEEADILAQQSGLPILIGDNSYTEQLDFDRNITQVLNIPEYKELRFLYDSINQGYHQVIYYLNEYAILKNNIELYINFKKISSIYEEKYKVKFIYYCDEPGIKNCEIKINNQKVEEFSFVVN